MGVTPVTMKNPILVVVAANGAPQVDITLPKKDVASAKRARKSALVAREELRPPTVESALTMRQLLAVADAYALAAGRIVDVRLARRSEMTDPEARTLERCEDRLAKTIALLRVSELDFANGNGEQIAQLITRSVDGAVRILNTGLPVPRVVELAQSLADFAGVALTRDADQVTVAAQKLRGLKRQRGARS